MKTSPQGIELIKKHEGLRLVAYRCPANVWTIGYGHTRTAKSGMVISGDEADKLLRADIEMAERAVNQLIVANLTQNQYDALVSFVFNVGRGNFEKSTLRVTVNNDPNDKQISLEFKRWVYASKVLLPGLVRRRDEESNLYFRP
jgi:lysozyme